MTDKVVLTSLTDLQNQTTAVNAVNANNAAITTAIDNTLSRDGTSPNQMGANLDMNSNQIINLPSPTSPASPLRLKDLPSFNAGTFTVNTLPAGGATHTVLNKNSGTDYDAVWTATPTFTSITNGSTTYSGATSGTTVLQPTAIASGTLTLPAATDTLIGKATTDTITNKTFDSGGTGNVIKFAGTTVSGVTGTVNAVLSTAPTITGLNLGAGTASVDPLTFTAGTNLTVPVAGSAEYDGTCFYNTPVASNRGVNDIEHLVILSADYTLTDSNVAQKCFNATANGALTLPSSTTYFFEAQYLITNTGTTSHTWSTLFGGTATFTGIQYSIQSHTDSGPTPTGANAWIGWSNVATAVVATAAQTSATENVVLSLFGIMRINAGGTIIPQIKLSAATTGTENMKSGSFFRCWPLGSNTVTNVGNWS